VFRDLRTHEFFQRRRIENDVPQVAAQIIARFANLPAAAHPVVPRLVRSVYRSCEIEVLTRLAIVILDWMKRPMGTAWCADPTNSDPALRGRPQIPRDTPTQTAWFLDPVVNNFNPSFDVRANLDFHAWVTRPAAVAWVWRDCLIVYSTWRVMMFREPIMHALTEVQRELLEPVFRELRAREIQQLNTLTRIHVPLRGIIEQLAHHTWPPDPVSGPFNHTSFRSLSGNVGVPRQHGPAIPRGIHYWLQGVIPALHFECLSTWLAMRFQTSPNFAVVAEKGDRTLPLPRPAWGKNSDDEEDDDSNATPNPVHQGWIPSDPT
jgi:hypothetical protein